MDVCPKEPVGVTMFALAEQVQVEVRKLWRETVGVMRHMFMMLGIPPDQAIAIRYGTGLSTPFKQVSFGNAIQVNIAFSNGYLMRMRHVDTNNVMLQFSVLAEHTERVMVTRLNYTFQFVCLIISVHCFSDEVNVTANPGVNYGAKARYSEVLGDMKASESSCPA